MNSDYTETDIQVRYADIDSLNHVNNATFLTYLEMGRIDYFHSRFGTSFFQDNMMLMARVEIDYRSTIMLGNKIICRTRIEKVGNTSIVFGSEIIKDKDTVCATAKSFVVLVDGAGNKKTVPEEIRKLATQDGSIT